MQLRFISIKNLLLHLFVQNDYMQKTFSFEYEEYASIEDLQTEQRYLLEKAKEARQSAYAPYSHFLVGAAVLLESGTVIQGNNQENAAYPSGLCAERVAVFSAMAQFPNDSILRLAIVAGKDDNNANATAPCGACRQAILEYESKQKQPIEILFMGTTGKVLKLKSIRDLLPMAFDAAFL